MRKNKVLAIYLLMCSSFQMYSQISGLVFEDYNANAVQDVGEPPVSGIDIHGYTDTDAIGVPSYSAISGNDGTYTLTGLAAGEKLRLEFIIPTTKSYLKQGAAGNTSVVFATEGDVNVNVGFNNPNNYSTANPLLVTPCYIVGDYNDPYGSNQDVLVGLFYDWGTAPTNADKDDEVPFTSIHYARNIEIGTTWGTAWDRTTNTIYLAAYHKKHTDYGPNGPGAIYKMQIDPISGIGISAPSLFTDVAGFAGISVCGSHGADLNPSSDPATADLVGKCSLGDLDISDDNTKLYTVNLGDRKIIEIDIATGNMTNNWQFPTTLSGNGCFACGNANDVRPFGLKYRNGKLYIGAMCSGETTMSDNDVAALIYSLNPALGGAATIDEEFCFNWGTDLPDNGDNRHWYSGLDTETGGSTTRSYIFSDIEFYGNDLIMGFRDRRGDMTGNNVPGVPTDGQTRGEIVTAYFDTSTENWVLESNAQAGPNRPGSSMTFGNPDDGEFYWGDGANDGNGTNNLGAQHEDQSFGGLAQVNTQPIVMTSQTTRQPFNIGQTGAGGIGWLDNVTGGPVKSYRLYGTLGDTEPGSTFWKANGLGDIEGLTTPAPIEIGDYVWVDADGDGVQDPGEAPITGVTVGLYKDNNLVATTVTDGNGRYYFSSEENPVYEGGYIGDPLDSGSSSQDNQALELSNGNMEINNTFINQQFRDWAGMRFQNVNIPHGATITSAYIQYQTPNFDRVPEPDPAEIRIYGEDVDNAPLFANTADNLSTRTRTTASVDWTIPATQYPNQAAPYYRTPDISTIVQEVVDRAGWSINNSLAFLVEMNLNGNDGSRRNGGDQRLVVTFTTTTPISGTNSGDVLPDMNYEVRLNLSQPQITTPSYNLTTTNSTDAGSETGNAPDTDIRDSDGSETSGSAVIAFTTGKWGENNHGLDFGFRAAPSCNIDVANIVDIFCFSPIATPTDPTDDQMRFIINVTGTGVAADYTVSATQNGNPITLLPDDQGTYATDELFRTQNGLAGNGDLAITITDNVTAGCTFNITITDPNTCSSACTITPTATALACDDNGTNTDPADDTFDVIVAATAVNGGTQFTVSNGATLLGTFDYATGGTIIGLPADGSTITLTFADATDNTCTATADVSQTSCSDTDPCVLPKCMRVTLTKK